MCLRVCVERVRERERERERERYRWRQCVSVDEIACISEYLPGTTNSGAKSGGGNRFAEAASATSRFGAPPFRSLLLGLFYKVYQVSFTLLGLF